MKEQVGCELQERISEIEERTGRKPTLDEIYPRNFTPTGQWKILEVGRPPKGKPRGRRKLNRQ